MIKVSDEFLQTMEENTNFQCYGNVVLADGSEIELTPENFLLGGTRYRDGAEASGFPLGAAISKSIEIELMNDEEQFTGIDFFGAQIHLSLGLQLAETVEKISLGTYTVNSPATYGDTIIIEALDDMWRADQPYTPGISFPASLSTLYRDVCGAAGIPFHTATFRNSAYMIQSAPVGNYTQREMLGFIAMLAGGNARIGLDGYVQIIEYDFSGLYDVNENIHVLEKWEPSSFVMDSNDITITGLQTTSTDIDAEGNEQEQKIIVGEQGYMLNIENPLINDDPAFWIDLLGTIFVGATFRKFSGNHVSYPLAEFMDLIKFTDRKGATHFSFITDIDFSVGSMTELSNSAESAIRTGSQYTSPVASAIIEAGKLVAKERTARETQIAAINNALKSAGGMYETSEKQSDGSVIRYLHDKPTLTESVTALKLTSEAIGISNDGGKTYSYALAFTGEAVLQTLAAEGVEAEWIKADNLNAISSSIGGWNIGEQSIYKDVTDPNNTKIVYRVYIQPPLQDNVNGTWVLSCQKSTDGGKTFSPNFALLSDGSVTLGGDKLRFDAGSGGIIVTGTDSSDGLTTQVKPDGVAITNSYGDGVQTFADGSLLNSADGFSAWISPHDIVIGDNDGDEGQAWMQPGNIGLQSKKGGVQIQPGFIYVGDSNGNTREVLTDIDARVKKSGDAMTGPLTVGGTLSAKNTFLMGDKTGYQDGKQGVWMSYEGILHLQRSSAKGYHPYIGFYTDDAVSPEGMIRLNSASKYLEFLYAARYVFDGHIQFSGNSAGIYGTDPSGAVKAALNPQNASGGTDVGYGNYASKSGNTNLFGYDLNFSVANLASPGAYRPYRRRGDSSTITVQTAGFVTDNGKQVIFAIPMSEPIIGSPTMTVASGNGFILRQNGQYTHGSAASTYVKPDSYSARYYQNYCIYVTAIFSTTTNVTNNDNIGVTWNGTITFS